MTDWLTSYSHLARILRAIYCLAYYKLHKNRRGDLHSTEVRDCGESEEICCSASTLFSFLQKQQIRVRVLLFNCSQAVHKLQDSGTGPVIPVIRPESGSHQRGEATRKTSKWDITETFRRRKLMKWIRGRGNGAPNLSFPFPKKSFFFLFLR